MTAATRTSLERQRAKTAALRGYRWRSLLLLLMIVAYPILAYYGPKNGRAEFYPFFNWSLFTHASDVRSDVVLFVRELNGTVFEEPRLMFSMPDDFAVVRARDAQLPKFLDDYTKAHLGNDDLEVQRMEAVLLNRYLPEAASIGYDLALIRYAPTLRYKTGEINEVVVIKSVDVTR